MEIAGIALISIVIGLVIAVLVGSVVVHFAAKISGVKDPTFGKAIKVCIASGILSIIVSFIF